MHQLPWWLWLFCRITFMHKITLYNGSKRYESALQRQHQSVSWRTKEAGKTAKLSIMFSRNPLFNRLKLHSVPAPESTVWPGQQKMHIVPKWSVLPSWKAKVHGRKDRSKINIGKNVDEYRLNVYITWVCELSRREISFFSGRCWAFFLASTGAVDLDLLLAQPIFFYNSYVLI